MSEAEHPSSHYRTIEDVFTRALKDGQRKIGDEPISPADGMLSFSGPVHEGLAIQAKGLKYSVSELVFGGDHVDESFQPIWYTTVYLAPHNYHRVHSPICGVIESIKYVPGELWPVNKPAVNFVPRLFCRNERLIFKIVSNGASVFAVMVGALNVARMVSKHWPELTTHEGIKALPGKSMEKSDLSINVQAGDELGTFMLGSTVVLVYEKDSLDCESMKLVDQPQKICMGKSLRRDAGDSSSQNV